MKLIAPDYYTEFTCIGSQCSHNCCIGWEIDVDDFTLSYYKSLSGPLGQKLKESICIDNEGAHFLLKDDERCPFLEADGLCRLIKELGEESLCDICADHPRFRNYFSDRVEIGVGLSCEEAARIIVTNKKDVTLVVLDDDNTGELPQLSETEFFSEREKLFSLIQKKDSSLREKIFTLFTLYDISPFVHLSDWARVFLGFEHLNSEWPNLLQNLAKADIRFEDIFLKASFHKPFENLLHYFLLRHFTPSCSIQEKRALVGASILSVCMVAAVFFVSGNSSIESLIDVARLYSSEIEYSDVNFEQLLLILKDDKNV